MTFTKEGDISSMPFDNNKKQNASARPKKSNRN